MVKLFVGNLPENTDPLRLRGLFSQHVSVQECDVLKSYAFLHVANESDADKAIKRFNNYKFMGKEIHVERSTSRLRKQPGMGNKCFTCGAVEHKTSQCPGNGRKRNMSNGNQRPYKKPRPLLFDHPPLRHPFPSYNLNPFPPIQNNQHFPVPLVQQHQINHHPPQQQHQQTCWGYKMGSGNENDPELPCPQNPELLKLYEQYMDSRTRYFFYKEQLLKELRLQQQQPTSIPPTSQSLISLNTGGASFNEQSQSVMRVDLTQLSRPKKESDTMQSLSSAPLLPQQQTEQQKFISQQNTSIINNPQALLPPTNPSLINTSAQPLIENSGLNFSSIVSVPQSFQSQQQTAPLQYFSSGTGRIGAPPPTSCYQNTYNALPTNYSTNIAANLPGTSTQPNVSSVKQEPTPLSSIQAFCYN